jgi:GPI-anchor transamidase subunit K
MSPPSLFICIHIILFALLAKSVRPKSIFSPWEQNMRVGSPNLNWAVILCVSRYWYNYRHMANAVAVYQELRRLGWPDSQILLLVAEDLTTSPRNPSSPKIFLPSPASLSNSKRIFYDVPIQMVPDIVIDYVGEEVSPETIMRLMTNSLADTISSNRRLQSSSTDNILFYITGHGGDQFLKFHGLEDWNAQDLASMINVMHAKGLYRNLWMIIDTCQASSLFEYITAPNVLMLTSSRVGESSYSHRANGALGVSIIDRMTLKLVQFMGTLSADDNRTVQNLMEFLDPMDIRSTPFLQSSSTSLDFTKVSGNILSIGLHI